MVNNVKVYQTLNLINLFAFLSLFVGLSKFKLLSKIGGSLQKRGCSCSEQTSLEIYRMNSKPLATVAKQHVYLVGLYSAFHVCQ